MSRVFSHLTLAAAMTVSAQASTIFDAVAGSGLTAGQFGILAGSNSGGNLAFHQSNDNFQSQSGLLNIGIGVGTVVQFSGPGTISGNLIFEDATTQSNASISNTTVTGSNTVNQSQVQNAISAALSLSTFYGATTNINNGTAYTGQNITLGGNTSGTYYYTVSANTSLSGVTFTGTSSDVIVINVTGNSQVQFTGNLNLSGGLTADNVVFNFLGTSNFGGSGNHAATINADIIESDNQNNAPSAATYAGRIFDVSSGNSGGALNLVSGTNVDSPGVISATPEPGTLMLLAAGSCLIGLAKLRLRRSH